MSAEVDCRAVPEDAEGIGRFGVRSVLGATALVLGAVPYLLLWLLVQQSWAPLAGVDGAVAAALNRQVRDSPLLVSSLRVVTDLGGSGTAVLLLTLAMVFLLIRGRRRLAVFVATTGLGLAVLVPVTKAIAHRARPVVASPVVETPSNGSFPSWSFDDRPGDLGRPAAPGPPLASAVARARGWWPRLESWWWGSASPASRSASTSCPTCWPGGRWDWRGWRS